MTEKEANDKKFYVAAAAIDKDGHASPLELPLICQEEKKCAKFKSKHVH